LKVEALPVGITKQWRYLTYNDELSEGLEETIDEPKLTFDGAGIQLCVML